MGGRHKRTIIRRGAVLNVTQSSCFIRCLEGRIDALPLSPCARMHSLLVAVQRAGARQAGASRRLLPWPGCGLLAMRIVLVGLKRVERA